jgi:hypothetical protein
MVAKRIVARMRRTLVAALMTRGMVWVPLV